MKAIYKRSVLETPEIKSFQLMPETKISYQPGQWMYVTINPKSQETRLKRHFTISSSPTEDILQFTTKFRSESEYKQELWKLEEGSEIDINGPFGNFVLDQKDHNHRLFLAGGIGITPFRSMIKYVTDKNLELDIKLLYSGKTKQELAFAGELSKFNIVETEKDGRLDEKKIKELCPDFINRSWWIAGPPAFVDAMLTLGQKMGVVSENLKSEEFSGY